MATIYLNKARSKCCINYRLDGKRIRNTVGTKAEPEKLLKNVKAHYAWSRSP